MAFQTSTASAIDIGIAHGRFAFSSENGTGDS